MDARTQAMFAELERQLRDASRMCVNLQGELAFVREERDKARAEVIRLGKELEALTASEPGETNG